MIIGVIYKYTSPDGTVYIGQTIDECYRRGLFFLAKRYGGTKIDKARIKFGPENFKYDRIFINEYSSKKLAKLDLDKLEAYYIELYDSVNTGYNILNGTNLPPKSTTKRKKYKYCGVPPIKYPKHEIGVKNQFKAVIQYNIDGDIIATYDSLSKASRITGIDIGNIVKCCKGKAHTARGFIFKYKEELL